MTCSGSACLVTGVSNSNPAQSESQARSRWTSQLSDCFAFQRSQHVSNSFSLFPSVILSLEVKLHLLHSYMNVKWVPVSSDAQVRTCPPQPRACSCPVAGRTRSGGTLLLSLSRVAAGSRFGSDRAASDTCQKTRVPALRPASGPISSPTQLCFLIRKHIPQEKFSEERLSLLCPKSTIHRPLRGTRGDRIA